MIIHIKKFIGSGFYSGFFPIAPGTIGSLFALMIFFIPGFENPMVIIPVIIFSIIIGIPIGNYFESFFGKDPSRFTLDEFIGTWISLLFIPKILYLVIIDFVIWRIMDILKPFPANIAEKLNGGLGIISDDIISGMYSLLIMHIFIFIFL